MEQLRFELPAPRVAGGRKPRAIVGVVASGNLEVLVERQERADRCLVEIATAAHGFAPIWAAVLDDFVARQAAGGLRINHGSFSLMSSVAGTLIFS